MGKIEVMRKDLSETLISLMGELEYQKEVEQNTSSHVVPEFPLSAALVAIQVNLDLAKKKWYNSRAPYKDAMEYIRKIGAICIKMGIKYGMPERPGYETEKCTSWSQRYKLWDMNACYLNDPKSKEASFDFKEDVAEGIRSSVEEGLRVGLPEVDAQTLYVLDPNHGLGTMKLIRSFDTSYGTALYKGNVSFFMTLGGEMIEDPVYEVGERVYTGDQVYTSLKSLALGLTEKFLDDLLNRST